MPSVRRTGRLRANAVPGRIIFGNDFRPFTQETLAYRAYSSLLGFASIDAAAKQDGTG
jgi:hypothetical protein